MDGRDAADDDQQRGPAGAEDAKAPMPSDPPPERQGGLHREQNDPARHDDRVHVQQRR